MNWRLIFMFALLGIVVAAAALWGPAPGSVTLVLSILAAAITANELAKRAPGKFFLHGLLAGGLGSTLTSLLEAGFINQYFANNPKASDSLKMLGHGMSPQLLMLIAIPISAGFSGIITGLLTLLRAKLLKPKPAATQAP